MTKNDTVPRGQILTSAFTPVAILATLASVALWFGWGWRQDTTASNLQTDRARKEANESARRTAELRANKPRIDAAWLELSAGTLRLAAASNSAAGGAVPVTGGTARGLAVGEVPLNRGAAAATGFGAPGRARDLPESLQALAEADLVILAQPANGDRRFRRWVVGTDKVEFGRLLPLLASVESRFPLSLVEEAVFSLPPGIPPFGTEPRALDSRLLVRLPVYDAAARQDELRERQRRRGPANATPRAAAGRRG